MMSSTSTFVAGAEFARFARADPKVWMDIKGAIVKHTNFGDGTVEAISPRDNYIPLITIRFSGKIGAGTYNSEAFTNGAISEIQLPSRLLQLFVVWSEQAALDKAQALAEEEARIKQEELQKIEENKRIKLIEEQEIQKEIEKREFEQLVAEMLPLGFTHSHQVSRYILKNRLGYKYKNISGIVQMENDNSMWDFNGGFPPMIYARLCDELGLNNQGTRARAVGFKSFRDLEANRIR